MTCILGYLKLNVHVDIVCILTSLDFSVPQYNVILHPNVSSMLTSLAVELATTLSQILMELGAGAVGDTVRFGLLVQTRNLNASPINMMVQISTLAHVDSLKLTPFLASLIPQKQEFTRFSTVFLGWTVCRNRTVSYFFFTISHSCPVNGVTADMKVFPVISALFCAVHPTATEQTEERIQP